MGHHKHHTNPVPPGNRPKGRPEDSDTTGRENRGSEETNPTQQQDPKRRLGDYEGAGEHSIQQPGGRNDANH